MTVRDNQSVFDNEDVPSQHIESEKNPVNTSLSDFSKKVHAQK